MAHVAAAIYRQGARNGGDFHRIPAHDERDVSPVLDLIELIRQRARLERGIELETEVEIIGD